MSNKGVLESDITTGISSRMGVQRKKTHRVIQAWHGKHFADKGWAPTSLLVFLTELGILKRLKVGEALTSIGKQTDVWLSKGHGADFSIIGKFMQRSKAEGKRLRQRLLADPGELDFLVNDTCKSGVLFGAP